MRRPLLALAAVLIAAPACAHDLWITLSSGRTVPQIHLHYGHPDDLARPQADKLVAMTVSDARGTRAIAPAFSESAAGPILVSEPLPGLAGTIVAARYDNGFWTKAPDGSFRNTTKRLLPGAAETIASVKFAKLVTGAEAPYAEPVGHELEIVPLDDPSATEPGGTLRVKVLFRGAPVAGARILRSDGEAVPHDRLLAFTTDAAGIAAVQIEKAGGEILSVSPRIAPSATPDLADADTFSATLSYVVEAPRTN
ncbi:DUF4198 domain-containing protein [Enterovirga sp.]|uniref:DUF4198 domain-containing protein n=1 Tax=Enterovirga sp. TaxID=2026350 RepID=UPI002B59943B|nr:DUF4198 domain-containing protein [Enterovirga sp.]HMO27929.1 DUF4198 domain-containing protein [Enterovirga sp.]